MKCHLCSQEGTIFLTKFVDSKLQQFCYCQKCALEKGLLNTEVLNTSIIEELPFQEPEYTVNARTLTVCPACEFTLDDWRRTRRLGCNRCYSVFSADIALHIDNIQDHCEHKGKKPIIKINRDKLKARKQTLQKQLEVAVEQENYEEAAKLRDELSHLSA